MALDVDALIFGRLGGWIDTASDSGVLSAVDIPVEDCAVGVVIGVRPSSCCRDDILICVGAWGSSDGDVNGDGTTDVNDILALIGAFGSDC